MAEEKTGPGSTSKTLYSAQSLRDSYAAWLSGIDWDSFATLTFRLPRSVKRTAELLSTFLSEPVGLWRVEIAVWGAEPHKSGNGHAHALIKWHPWIHARAQAARFFWDWLKRFGRCDVRPYNPDLAAAHYLTKYVLKDSLNAGEWDIFTKGGTPSEVGRDGNALHVDPVRDGRSGERLTGVWHPRCWRSKEEVEEDLDQEERRHEEAEQAEAYWQECQRKVRQERIDIDG